MSTTSNLSPCPCCGGEARLTTGYASGQVWAHGEFHRVYCGACQLRQHFHRTTEEAVAAWNKRTVPAVLIDVAAERRRQIEVEGWTPEHDDKHADGEIASAAACYALRNGHHGVPLDCGGEVPRDWPWADEWWKPKAPRHDLIRALALLAAEVERLDRATGETR